MLRRPALWMMLASLCISTPAQAFTHVVQKGETLASIAEKIYGRIQHERILVAANALEAQGGIPIVPGMRLEVPAVSYRRIHSGDTWAALAEELLGSAQRSDVLAVANGTNPWLPPEIGEEIVVPYNLRVIVHRNETIMSLAYKFMGEAKKAWVLHNYNGLKKNTLVPGSVLLVPLTDLPLTPEGQEEASRASVAQRTQGKGQTRREQLRVRGELPALIADVRGGRYLDAVRRGNRFLSTTELTKPQLAVIHRQLLEAYVAFGATGLAAAACTAWRENDPGAAIDPVWLSPKIVEACRRGRR